MNMQFEFGRPEITEIFCDEDKSDHPVISVLESPVKIERHQEREILIPLKGAFTFFFGENTFHAERGMAFLVDSWVSHSSGYQAEKEEQVQLWIHLHPKNIYATLLKIVAGDPVRSEWTSAELPIELLALISRRWNMLGNPQLSSELAKKIRRSIVEVILDELEFLNNYQVNNSGAHLDPVKFIKRYIESTHGCNCVIADFEKTTGYDRSYLARLFKAKTGITISDYIDQVRFGFVSVASGRGLTQKEIAVQLGFSNSSSLSRWKKTYQEKFKK
ncbi:MAG: Helix-turn-helix domain protein [Lentisphaerae bacterium ADurb.Bin242]|nr:MAG: Helix-turn-helix domain protein [Lentisphaerae bacterium ADurb.Bin242]